MKWVFTRLFCLCRTKHVWLVEFVEFQGQKFIPMVIFITTLPPSAILILNAYMPVQLKYAYGIWMEPMPCWNIFLRLPDVMIIGVSVVGHVHSASGQRKHQSHMWLVFLRESKSDWWIPFIKNQSHGKYFQLMTSSCSVDPMLFHFLIHRSMALVCGKLVMRCREMTLFCGTKHRKSCSVGCTMIAQVSGPVWT